MYEFFMGQQGTEPDKDILAYLPSGPIVSLDGTKEGFHSVADAVVTSGFGALNLEHEEILDVITSSAELMNSLKLAYDGFLPAKVIKGGGDIKRTRDIYGLRTNLLAMGSKDNVDKETQKALDRLAKTGMYRRSLVVHSDMRPEANDGESFDLEPVKQHFKKIDDVFKEDYRARVNNFGVTGDTSSVFAIESDAEEYIEDIDSMLMANANENQLDQFAQYDVGSLKLIVDMGYIICYIEGRQKVEKRDLEKAYDIFKRTRERASLAFREVKPHEEVYNLLKMKDGLTHSDILDYQGCDCIPKNKGPFKDVMLLVQELCYKNGEELKVSKGIVERYSIKELPNTSLDDLVFSLSVDDKGKFAVAYEATTLKWENIPALAVSYRREELDEYDEPYITGIDSFTLAHYEPSAKTDPFGHRREQSFIQGQNMIGLDFDSGVDTIESVREKLDGYTYLLYTTKSHRSEKSGGKDRFRVLIPTKTKYYVSPEQHKEMYANFGKYFEFDLDKATFNVSRLFWPNKHAEVIVNHGDELLDIQPFIPDTNIRERFIKLLKNYNPNAMYINEDDDEATKRIDGFRKRILSELAVGNLNNSLFKLAKFVQDLTGDNERAIRELKVIEGIAGFPAKHTDEIIKNMHLA